MNLVPMNIKSDNGGCMPCGSSDSSPCIYLTDDQVEALGIKGIPNPGAVFMLQAKAVVDSVTASAEDPTEGEGTAPDVRLSLRLTDMAVSGTRTADDLAKKFYGG